jgi:hypothetical protein
MQCHSAFYSATSNARLAMGVCAVCARLMNKEEAQFKVLPLSTIPNLHCLSPATKIQSKFTIQGVLLTQQAVFNSDGTHIVQICHDCLTSLIQLDNLPPKYLLANGLWIGEVPWQLQLLTLPEQLLVACLYPHVFIVKLFPKDCRVMINDQSLTTALRGNVTTYELNIPQITEMIQGTLMLQNVSILLSVLSIAFIGYGRVEKTILRSLFRVWRKVVAKALMWLRINNPQYYGDIDIDQCHLDLLLEDDVPNEILATAHQEDDAEVLDIENDTFVLNSDNSVLSKTTEGGNTEGDVIPLQYPGTIDTALTKLTSEDLLT